MPPKEKMSDEVIDDFVRWVEIGAPDPQPSARRPSEGQDQHGRGPPVLGLSAAAGRGAAGRAQDAAWPRTDIDRFVLARLERKASSPWPMPTAPR